MTTRGSHAPCADPCLVAALALVLGARSRLWHLAAAPIELDVPAGRPEGPAGPRARSSGRRTTRTRRRRPSSAGCSTSTSGSRSTARSPAPVATTRSSPSPTAQPFSKGIRGQLGGRSAPTVINRAYSLDQFWDGRAKTLEEQAKGPIANPIEMGHTHDLCEKCIGGDRRLPQALQGGLRHGQGHDRPHRQGHRHVRADRPVRQLALRQVQGRRQERL